MTVRTVQRNELEFVIDDLGNEFFWGKFVDGSWEPRTYSVFDKYVDAETVFIDVGGWIGPTSLYAAQLAKRTLCLEPDPVAFGQLEKNLALNRSNDWAKSIQLLNRALWYEETSLVMEPVIRLGDSTSSIARVDQDNVSAPASEKGFECRTITLDRLVSRSHDDPGKFFMKIDIEGAEYLFLEDLVDKLRELRVTVFLSTHPQNTYFDKSRNIARRLYRRLYQSYKHFRFCRRLKQAGYTLKTDDRGNPYSPLMNSLRWLLFQRMDKDIVLVPNTR